MLSKDGIPTAEDIAKVLPSAERLAKGPVAIAECFQEIPCNPCSTACPFKAITVEPDINACPEVHFDECTGCGTCVLRCPGLAIFVVDCSYSDTMGKVTLPYEYLPVPAKGDVVKGLNRAGEVMGDFEVTRVVRGNAKNKTYAITVEVPKELVMEVRNIRVGGE